MKITKAIREIEIIYLLLLAPVLTFAYLQIQGLRYIQANTTIILQILCLVGCCFLLRLVKHKKLKVLNLLIFFSCVWISFIFFGLPRSFSMIHQQDVLAANRFRTASLISLPIIILISALVEILMNKYFVSEGNKLSSSKPEVRAVSALATAGLLLGTFIFSVYIFKIWNGIPLVNALNGSGPENLLLLRRESLAKLSPPVLASLVQFTRDQLFPAVSAVFILVYLQHRTLKAGLLALLSVTLSVSISVINLEKSPLINLTVLYLSVVFMGAPKFKKILVWLWLPVAASILFLTKITNAPDRTFSNLFYGISKRVFLSPAEIAGEYFVWAPRFSNGFLRGSGLPLFHHFSTLGSVDAPSKVYSFLLPGSTNGSANGAFHAMAWAEFGWTGVVIAGIVAGIVMSLFSKLLQLFVSVELRVVATALTFVAVLKLVSTSLQSSVLAIGFSFLDLLFFLFIADRLLSWMCSSLKPFDTKEFQKTN